MCGIVGFVGNEQAAPILLDGLSKLEYRGYDSAGIAYLKDKTIKITKTTGRIKQLEQKIENKIQEILVTNGLSEIYTYGFLSEKDLEKSKIKKELIDNAITIINPLGDEFKLMRPTTIPSMMQILAGNNNKKNQNVKLFDISRNYKNIDNQVEKGEVPLQENILTIGMYGEDVDFYTLKGLVENILEAANVNRYDIERETTNESYHPGRCANLKVGIDTIATFGEVHPEVLMNYEINKRVYLAEINITKIVKYSKANKKYTEVPKFPAAERDIAVIVDEDVQVGDIEKAITKKCKRLLKGQKGLEELKLFDIYRDEKIGENKKSVAYSLIFRDKTKSLSDDEINPVMEEITKELEEKFKAELRK